MTGMEELKETGFSVYKSAEEEDGQEVGWG